MSEMISVASGFQYSVNIAYDLNSDDKLKNFIPTKSALRLMEEILNSTQPSATNRARVLVGAYGKGKSHIVLTILSLLMKKDLHLFEKLMPVVDQNQKLHQCIENYYESDNKLLPIIITGSNTNLTQSFLVALQRTLAENGLLDIMPETNYKAAAAAILRWKESFPETYKQFKAMISCKASDFVARLKEYDIKAYEEFDQLYPSLTAGSLFNPFLGFDVVELYSGVASAIKQHGYTGLYVVYDEFSKYLEANIAEASVSDTKMLQDFAEKCARSGSTEMHLMLICHKEIANYIDTLPKQKTDGWRGVSERFSHIHLNNNFSQTYEIIASVIQKKKDLWDDFTKTYADEFASIKHSYGNHAIFSDINRSELRRVIYGCYPLHPISTYILPRLSERIAQNERTLFTFLSANGFSTLPSFLSQYNDKSFSVITPDLIFDYFEPLFKKDVYAGALHENYVLTRIILDKLPENSLGQKIIKTLSLIYMLEQFEKLKPTKTEIFGIFSVKYPVEDIEAALVDLIERKFVIYQKKSNGFLRLKDTVGIDVRQKIKDSVALQKAGNLVKKTLNSSNFDNYMYPSRYNDEKEMTRFFSFEFIEDEEVSRDVNWEIKSESIDADGVVYGIIPKSKESLAVLREDLLSSSVTSDRCVFILPTTFESIAEVVQEYTAVAQLKDQALGDRILFEEYEVIFEDLREIILNFISSYTRPEKMQASYFHNGIEQSIQRKASLTELLSKICDSRFSDTPVINNEAINRKELTSVSIASRGKIVAGLLRTELENNLGLSGNGQEVSIMRSTLVRPGILDTQNGIPVINLHPQDNLLENVLDTIVQFISESRQFGQQNFSVLYRRLTSAERHIGLRTGLVPIYLAAVFHEYKKEIIIYDRFSQVPLSNDVLLQINADPDSFSLSYLNWDADKEQYVALLSKAFENFIGDSETINDPYGYVVFAMRRWYMSLPKYTKELKRMPSGEKIDYRYLSFLKLLKQNTGSHELLFEKIPDSFGYKDNLTSELAEMIVVAKNFYDSLLERLKEDLITEVKKVFCSNQDMDKIAKMSLTSIVLDWIEGLDPTVNEQLFADGTERLLGLFRTASNDENALVVRIAKLTTDLRIEDWDEKTLPSCVEQLKTHKKTAESFKSAKVDHADDSPNMYQLMYTNENGETATRRFGRIETSKRGVILHNAIESALSSMGQSISEQEKRQILMDILKEMC